MSGSVDLDDYDSAGADRCRPGFREPCCPCVAAPAARAPIRLPYDSSGSDGRGTRGGRAGHRREQVANETVRLEVQLPGRRVRARPVRCASRRPAPTSTVPIRWRTCRGRDRLQFFIRWCPAALSPSGWRARKPGDAVELSAPHGTFFPPGRPARLFVAGGTGVALPVDAARHGGPAHRAAHHLLIGARTPGHLFALDELRQLGEKLQEWNCRWPSEQDADAGCHAGYAADLIPQLGLDPSTRVYLRPAADGGSLPPPPPPPLACPRRTCSANASPDDPRSRETCMIPITRNPATTLGEAPRGARSAADLLRPRDSRGRNWRVFTRAWLFVGHESQGAQPATSSPPRMGAESVIPRATRRRRYTCSELVPAPRHEGVPVRPRQHAALHPPVPQRWSYTTDGKLSGVPQFASCRRLHGQGGVVADQRRIWKSTRGTVWASWDKTRPIS